MENLTLPLNSKTYYYQLGRFNTNNFFKFHIVIVTPQQHRSRETLPVCQWRLPVQDSLLYQAGCLETDLQLDSGTRVRLHQSSENQGGKPTD